jgi:hypothetical protein
MRDRIAKMDQEIEAYRTILREQPVTAPEVGKWMAETVQDKRRLENLLGLEPTTKLTVDDVKAMVASLRDITRSLALADPAIKAAAYAELGVTVTYHKEGRALLESRPQASDVADVRVGGPSSAISYRPLAARCDRMKGRGRRVRWYSYKRPKERAVCYKTDADLEFVRLRSATNELPLDWWCWSRLCARVSPMCVREAGEGLDLGVVTRRVRCERHPRIVARPCLKPGTKRNRGRLF